MTKLYFIAAVLFAASALGDDAVPALQGRVNDYAGILQPAQVQTLEALSKAQETATTNQVVILIEKKLDGKALEPYVNQVFNTWKLGQKDKDNGVLIAVFVDDHKMRIEVGKGLEGALTDATAMKIINEKMKPKFRTNDFAGGLTDAVNAIGLAITGEFTAEAADSGLGLWWFLLILLLGMASVVGLLYWLGDLGEAYSSHSYSGDTPACGILTGSAAGFTAHRPAAPRGSASHAHTNNSTHSSASDYSSPSSYSGGGGFSGGGGDSGGGGASGGW